MPRPSTPARLCAGLFAAAVTSLGAGTGVPAATASPTGGVPTDGGAASSVSSDEDERGPLRLTIDHLTPGVLPDKGPIRIRGTVTNHSEETWTSIQLFPFAGTRAPMTTAAELEVASDTSPTAVVGPRITDVMDQVDELAPGETASYRLSVPRALVTIETPGIYWFGVHALGQSVATPRDTVADGRARTFLPHLPDPEGVVPTSVVVPLRSEIDHTTHGAVAHPGRWQRQLSDGALRRLLDFGAAADDEPVTWLLDPALLDTVEQLRIGNPTRSIAPTLTGPVEPREGTQETEAPVEPGDADDPGAPDTDGDQSTPNPTGTPSPETPPSGDTTGSPTAGNDLARTAEEWLATARPVLRGTPASRVLALPYGDIDVPAAAEHAPDLYATARTRRGAVADAWSLGTTPGVTSPSGFIDAAGLDLVDDNAALLLTDRMFPAEEFPDGAPTVVTVDGHRAAVASYAAQSGGPGPDHRRSAIALRQRVLSEAAARVFEAGSLTPRPLLVTLPPNVGGDPAEFWAELDQPWLDLASTEEATGGAATAVASDQLDYPEREQNRELTGAAFDAAEQVTADGPILQDLLTLNDTISERLTRETLVALGYGHRDDRAGTVDRLWETAGWVDRRLTGIELIAPPGVTLSSGAGDFAITVQNNLDQPVTIGIRGRTAGAEVDSVEPQVIPPESHTTVFLNARADGTGVHNLPLEVVTPTGAQLGVATTVPLRSAQASVVIWWILGTGAGIVVLAVTLRVLRRLRGAASGDSSGVSGAPTGATAPGDAP